MTPGDDKSGINGVVRSHLRCPRCPRRRPRGISRVISGRASRTGVTRSREERRPFLILQVVLLAALLPSRGHSSLLAFFPSCFSSLLSSLSRGELSDRNKLPPSSSFLFSTLPLPRLALNARFFQKERRTGGKSRALPWWKLDSDVPPFKRLTPVACNREFR